MTKAAIGQRELPLQRRLSNWAWAAVSAPDCDEVYVSGPALYFVHICVAFRARTSLCCSPLTVEGALGVLGEGLAMEIGFDSPPPLIPRKPGRDDVPLAPPCSACDQTHVPSES